MTTRELILKAVKSIRKTQTLTLGQIDDLVVDLTQTHECPTPSYDTVRGRLSEMARDGEINRVRTGVYKRAY